MDVCAILTSNVHAASGLIPDQVPFPNHFKLVGRIREPRSETMAELHLYGETGHGIDDRSPDEQQRLGCEVQNLWAAVTREGEQCWQSTGLHDRCLGSLRIGKRGKGGDSVQLQLRRV